MNTVRGSSWIACLGVVFAAASEARAADRAVPVSVTRFNQKTEHVLEGCSRWDYNGQDQLRTVLESELSSKPGLKVLERESVREMVEQEYGLPYADRASLPRKGRMLSARYAITGGITEQGVCEEGSADGVELGGIVGLLGGPSGVGLGVGTRHGKSRVKLTANLVRVETGEVIRSFTATSEVAEGGVSVGASYHGIGASHKQRNAPPIERATNQALADLAGQISDYLSRE